MCFSLAGRLQTRAVALLVPGLTAVIIALVSGDQRYFGMFIIMALLGIDLDLLLYPRLIRYQTRWHTYLIGIGEFWLTLWLVRWLAGTVPLVDIIWFYAATWLAGYVVVHAVLPVIDLTWSEHGGEVFRPAVKLTGADSWIARLRAELAAASGTTLSLASLVALTLVVLTALPVALQPLQAAASVIGAVLVGLAARWHRGGHAPGMQHVLVLGLVMPLLLRGPGILPFLLAGGLAVALASWLRIGRQPVFNAAACTYLVMLLAIPGMYSADDQWGNSLLLPLAMANLVVLLAWRSQRLPLLLAFGAVLIAHLSVLAYNRHEVIPVLLPQLLPTYLIFLAGFILIEPATTPDGTAGQVLVGALVGGVGLILERLDVGLSFVVALLLANYGYCLWAVGVPIFRRRPGQPEPQFASSVAVTRRTFLAIATALGGSVLLGGALRQLLRLDPAVLSLPAEPVLAGGQAIPRFAEVAGRAGIVLTHHGDSAEGNPAIGTGVAWGDYDIDGQLDLYVTDHMGRCHLYHNNGDGNFTDVGGKGGVATPGMRATSATFVDYDNDGWPDLYVGISHGSNVLYHNNRDGTFSDVTEHSGLGDPGRTMSTAWGDYDGDGYLDVFVANYTDEPITFDPDAGPLENARTIIHIRRPFNHLYHNNGDGTFSDVTHLLGYEELRGLGFSATWFDYNNDGRPDLYVAYDFGHQVVPNKLWRNDGPSGAKGWRFTRVEDRMGVATQANPMGIATGDYNNDGWLDMALSNIGPNLLYRSHRGRVYQDMARRAHVTHPDDNVGNTLNPTMTWGVVMGDFNNDGWLDLFFAAGAMDFENMPQPNFLYLNDHAGGFIDVSAPSGTDDPGQGRSVAIGDYDGDGYLDMFVSNYGQAPLLYRNVSRAVGNHWLRLRLEGTQSNRDAVGARVMLFARGLPPQMREVQIGQGLGSCNEKTLHFGLGTVEQAERVEIHWPSGRRQVLKGVRTNHVLDVREPGSSRWPNRGAVD